MDLPINAFPVDLTLTEREWQIVADLIEARWVELDKWRVETPFPADQEILERQNEITTIQNRWREMKPFITATL